MNKPNILPDSRLKSPKNVNFHLGFNWVPIFCANCGADGGFVPEEHCNFAFYLCQPCADKLPPIEGTYVEPDRVFWEKVKQAQIEKYGHELSSEEIAVILNTQESSIFHQLAKERGK